MDPIELSVEDDSLFAANQSRMSTVAGSDYQDSILTPKYYDFSSAKKVKALKQTMPPEFKTKLDLIRRQSIVLQMYNEYIKTCSHVQQFNRHTYLDAPLDQDFPTLVELTMDDDLSRPLFKPKLTKEQKLQDYELQAQFLAGAVPPKPQELQLMVQSDIKRLFTIFLEGNDELKNSLPTKNIKQKLFMKSMTQTRERLSIANFHFSEVSGSQLQSSQMGSVSDASSIRSSRQKSVQSHVDLTRSDSVASLSKSQGLTEELEVLIPTPCSPFLVHILVDKTLESQLKWWQFVNELQTNADVMCSILVQSMQRVSEDEQLRQMVVNLSQFFFDNLFQQQRLAFAPKSKFLRMFYQFCQTTLKRDQFGKDAISNICIKDQALLQTLKLLFEGLTRRLPALDYLKLVFNNILSQVDIHQIKKDIKTLADNPEYLAMQSQRRSQPTNQKSQVMQQNQKKPEDDKRGWLSKKWDSIFNKTEKQVVIKAPKQNKERKFASLNQVYGGEADSFKDFVQPSFEEMKQDLQIPLTNFDFVEETMKAERINQFQYAFEDYKSFVPAMSDRVIRSRKDVKTQELERRPSEKVLKEYRDLTYHVKQLVGKAVDKLLFANDKTPFAIRAFLKILVLQARGVQDLNTKMDVTAFEVRMLSDFVVAGWLNTGFRNAKSFGLQAFGDKDIELEYEFLRACRITFEHLMMMQLIPDIYIEGISVYELNQFITKEATKVIVYWEILLSVNLNELKKPIELSLVETCLCKVDDLQMLVQCAAQIHHGQSQVLSSLACELAKSGVEELVPLQSQEHEYYVLFSFFKSQDQFQSEYAEWQVQSEQLVSNKTRTLIAESNRPQQDQESLNQRRKVVKDHQQSDLQMIKHILKSPTNIPQSQLSPEQSLHLTGQLIAKVAANSQFNLNQYNASTLIDLFKQAAKKDSFRLVPDHELQTICSLLTAKLAHCELKEEHQLLDNLHQLLQIQIDQSKKYLCRLVDQQEQLAIDCQTFECSIVELKQFSNKSCVASQLNRVIARQNVEVCLLECFHVSEEFEKYRGVMLNLCCTKHSNKLPVSCFMVFGGVNRRQEDLQKLKQEEEQTILMTADQKILQDALNKKKQIFQKFYREHTAHTQLFQKERAIEFKTQDEQIMGSDPLIDKLIGSKEYRDHLKAMVRAEPSKYQHLLQLYSHQLEQACPSEQERLVKMMMDEPLDHYGFAKLYEMYLQHISVLCSTSADTSYIDQKGDDRFWAMQFYDFLKYDLQAKAIRYNVHDYMIKRIFKSLFGSGNPSDMDNLVQQLILNKDSDPNWNLSSPGHQGDFTDTPEWCDTKLYEPSLRQLMKLPDAETPHQKAVIIEKAVLDTVHMLMIVKPYRSTDKVGAQELDRVSRYLMLQMCKQFKQNKKQPRLHSNLLFTLLFNVPQNEILVHQLLKKRRQDAAEGEEYNFTKLNSWEQQQMILGQIKTRNRVYEWFEIIKGLVAEHHNYQL